ncbi:hypothetical protein BC941DRAFT_474549 [Chlamydoabsidia padenii]|nr:hypothetical protein BC941DRAFT_474549 [Chlamydoabsidia padenii]
MVTTTIPLTTTKNDQPPPQLISFPPNVLTLQDVILDSPAFRSNLEQVAEQSDHFERWLEGFVRGLKQFLDSLSKTNTYTSQLCKQLVPGEKEYAFIGNSQVASMAINGFASALECSLSAKVKLVDDLNKSLLQPLQSLLKMDMKEFKDMRRTFEKTFDKYENHLSRYSNLSKQKEPSALREDAFQMFDIQKSYVRASGTYFMQLINLKSKVEHMLVDCFSSGLIGHLDHLNLSLLSQNSARSMIPGWRQWLDESIATCDYQLERIQQSTQALEDIYIRQIRPHRSLKRYSISTNDQLAAITNSSAFDSLSDDDNGTDSPPGTHPTIGSSTSLPSSTSFEDIHTSLVAKPSSSSILSTSTYSSTTQKCRHIKQGYLFCRIAVGKPSRYIWTRHWFFLKDGWFGQYSVSTVNKVKGALVIGDRIPVDSSLQYRIYTDIYRRFCFKVHGPESSFFLQAETEQDMQQWLRAIECAKELYGKEHTWSVEEMAIPRALLSPKAATSIRKPGNDQHLVTLSVSPPSIPSVQGLYTCRQSPVATDYLMNEISTTSALTTLMIRESSNTKQQHFDATDSITDQQSLSHGDQQHINTSVRRTTTASTVSSWSMPWLMSALTANNVEVDSDSIDGWIQKPRNNQEPGAYVIWPNKVELDVPKVRLNNYSDDLVVAQRELRRYFARVPDDEIVLDVFSASFYRQSSPPKTEDTDSDMDTNLDTNQHSTGNGYSGTIYMTQKRLWFYSCRMMTCVNALVIPLKSIKTTRLEKIRSETSQGMLMYIDTKEASSRTYCFGLWLEIAELIVERLRIATKNVARSEKLDDQSLFDAIRCTTIGKIKSKTPTSQIIATTTSNAAVTPITVQAQARLTTEPQAIFEHNSGLDIHSSSPSSISSSLSESSGLSGAKLLMEQQHRSTSPAAGALAAAMEAANEARNAKVEAHLTKKPSKKSISENNTTVTTDNLKESKVDSKGMTSIQDDDSNTDTTTKQLPTEPVVCGCDDHLDKTQAELDLPISAQALYDFMFGTTCWEQLNKEKGNSAPSASDWQQISDTNVERILNYTMPNPMVKAKDAEVIETHQILKQEIELCYVFTITTKVPMLPYADAFIPTMKFCITYNSPNTCRLVCNIGVKWLKSVMVKGMINRAALKGMGETISALTLIVERFATQDKSADDSKKQQKQRNATGLMEQQGTSTLDQQDVVGNTKQEGDTMQSNILASATILSPQRLVIFVGVALLLLFSTTLLRTRSPFTLSHSAGFIDNSMGNLSRRAVHLIDLESLVNGNNVKLDQYNSSTYQAFKNSRSDFGNWNYQWLNIHLRLIAAELAYTREQLAVIRYELLTTFNMLNGMDQQLMENEYWTWLLDQRSQCIDFDMVDSLEQQSDSSHNHLVLCNEINKTLESSVGLNRS